MININSGTSEWCKRLVTKKDKYIQELWSNLLWIHGDQDNNSCRDSRKSIRHFQWLAVPCEACHAWCLPCTWQDLFWSPYRRAETPLYKRIVNFNEQLNIDRSCWDADYSSCTRKKKGNWVSSLAEMWLQQLHQEKLGVALAKMPNIATAPAKKKTTTGCQVLLRCDNSNCIRKNGNRVLYLLLCYLQQLHQKKKWVNYWVSSPAEMWTTSV